MLVHAVIHGSSTHSCEVLLDDVEVIYEMSWSGSNAPKPAKCVCDVLGCFEPL